MAKPFPIDHDLHCHSQLSLCSSDPKMTAAAILDFARAHNYTCQCVTDHFWDAGKPGSSNWYALQDYEHVRASLPLPQDPDGKVRMVFGCETEFCGKNKIGIKQATCDKFDFIVIPPNHFHMLNFVRPDTYNTEQKVADLFVERLEEISQRRLPWRKVGIAHITCGLTFRSAKRTGARSRPPSFSHVKPRGVSHATSQSAHRSQSARCAGSVLTDGNFRNSRSSASSAGFAQTPARTMNAAIATTARTRNLFISSTSISLEQHWTKQRQTLLVHIVALARLSLSKRTLCLPCTETVAALPRSAVIPRAASTHCTRAARRRESAQKLSSSRHRHYLQSPDYFARLYGGTTPFFRMMLPYFAISPVTMTARALEALA